MLAGNGLRTSLHSTQEQVFGGKVFLLKGSSDAKFEHKCVGSVCAHPSYNNTNPPYFKILFLKSGCSEIQNDVVLYRPLPRELIDRYVLP